MFNSGQSVNLNGSIYKGQGTVLSFFANSGGKTPKRAGIVHVYPQVVVRANDGKKYRYYGDDIAAGQVTAVASAPVAAPVAPVNQAFSWSSDKSIADAVRQAVQTGELLAEFLAENGLSV